MLVGLVGCQIYINMINRPQYAQREPNGVYAFDLKVNVDFNSGHMSLNVPNNAPFAKKNPQPTTQLPQNTTIPAPVRYQYIPIHEDNSRLTTMQASTNPQLLRTNYQQPFPVNPNTKHQQSLNTTSLRVQQAHEGVQCVICQKVVREESFSLHLQQHRNRNKHRARNSNSSSEVSIRNKDEEAEMVEMVNYHPHSYSQVPHSLNFSQSSPYSNQHGVSYSSNTVTLPLIQETAPLYYQHSPQQRVIYEDYPQNNSSHGSSFHLSQTGLAYPQLANPNSFSNGSQPSSRLSLQHHQQPINAGSPMPKDMNILQFHRIESMIIRPQVGRAERGFQDCGQSAISRHSQPTHFSQIHAIEGALQLHQNHESSSSDQQSIKVFPSKSYRSGPDFQKSASIRSTYTEKLTKTKLPVNYLAREQFITSSTSNSRKSKNLG